MNTNIKYSSKNLEKDFGPLTFGKMLKAHRDGEGISQEQLAKILGITKSSLCDLEKGRKIPSPKRAALIAKKMKDDERFFIAIALEDLLRKEKLNYSVEVKLNTKKAG